MRKTNIVGLLYHETEAKEFEVKNIDWLLEKLLESHGIWDDSIRIKTSPFFADQKDGYVVPFQRVTIEFDWSLFTNRKDSKEVNVIGIDRLLEDMGIYRNESLKYGKLTKIKFDR